MLDSVVAQSVLVIVILILLVVGMIFLFYPAIVVYRQSASPKSSSRRPTPVTISPTASDDVAASNDTLSSSSSSSPAPLLTVIIPAYEEEVRLPRMLQDAYTYLSSPNCRALVDLSSLRQSADSDSKIHHSSRTSNNHNNKKQPSVIVVEWIVVNDGSKDNTSQAYRDFVSSCTTTTDLRPNSSSNSRSGNVQMQWKLIVLECNRGKGAAVQAGMISASGEFCLMVDADGATNFGPGLEAVTHRLVTVTHAMDEMGIDESTRITKLQHPPHRYPIILGSRAHLHDANSTTTTKQPPSDDDTAGVTPPLSSNNNNNNVVGTTTTTPPPPPRRSFIRAMLMYAFHICVVVLIGANDVRDTQCGFKLFHRTAAIQLFRNLHLQRWAFDTELLFLATQLRYSMQEVVVPWHDVAGSKLHTSAFNLAWVSISMLRDMACVRLCYTLGLWKIRLKAD